MKSHSPREWLVRSLMVALSVFVLPASAEVTGTNAVVARQGIASVTLADIDAHVEHIPPKDRANFFDSPRRIQSLLRNLLLQKQLAAAAREAGLDRRPEFQAPLGSPTDAALAKAEIERFREALPKPDVAQLAREEFAAHKEKYGKPESVDVRHILVSTTLRSEMEARALADDVLERARKDPSTFEELVLAYSDEENKSENKGLMHDAGRKESIPEFAAAARKLAQPGDISPIVQSKFGFHILQLVAKVPAQPAVFDDVRADIEATMLKDYANDAVQRHTDKLRNMPIDADAALVASLRTRYVTQPSAEAGDAPAAAK